MKGVFYLKNKIVLFAISLVVFIGVSASTCTLAKQNKIYTKIEQDNIKPSNIVVKSISEDKQNDDKIMHTAYNAPYTNGFKSYMDYRSITSTSSKQYILQSNYAYTGNYGIRMVGDRYCIAIGSHFVGNIGQYVDLILENGTVIKCILADRKDDLHTDYENIITVHNGCMSEFVVDSDSLSKMVKLYGDISKCNSDWESPVKNVVVYESNIFN